MNLKALYAKLSPAEREALAVKAGIQELYLRQLARRFQNRRPSIPLMQRLVAADARLSFADLVAEFAVDVPEAEWRIQPERA